MSLVYRGGSLDSFQDAELTDGTVYGQVVNLYSGRLTDDPDDVSAPKGTPIEDLPWWTPDGFDPDYHDPWMTDQQGVAGGFAGSVGTAVGFAEGLPIVLYLRESDLATDITPVRYNRRWFTSTKGALAWVAGDNYGGEIRADRHGLVGLTTTTDEGVVVNQWADDIDSMSTRYENERELLAWDSEVDITDAVEGVAMMLEGQHDPHRALASFEGYSTGYKGDAGEQDVGDLSDAETMALLHDELLDRIEVPADAVWIIDLSTTVMDDVYELDAEDVEAATDGGGVLTDSDAVPDWLLGG